MLDEPQNYSELEVTQNPALGAYVLWQFGLGHQKTNSDPAPFPLCFLVLPMVYHAQTLACISSTLESSGLGKFVQKMNDNREELLALHGRALAMRPLSLNSIVLGTSRKLLSPSYENAKIRATSPELIAKAKIPERIKKIGPASYKVGVWFSQLDTVQIVRALNVSL
ncbi:hypothetical protein J7443_19265 [Tropicibacter sp. R15_0]|uniref:three component ABC system middle component n=1 Tax=Tropicibacter sp. R15_0 TaxID=2821101 RepID=UPI001AD9FFF8|nr:three component ABC system middle component [Tropicibacter sp. R15_0]MBO9467388.1 hypothetical protein [Tropicibacter sp. R15_0]